MLKHNEIRKGKMIILKDDPYEVLNYSHTAKGRGKSVVQTKLKNIRTGNILQRSFHPGEEVEEAELEKMDVIFIYSHRNKYVFRKKEDASSRFDLEESQVNDKKDYLKENTPVVAVVFEEKIIGLAIPIKMNLKVKEAPPGIRGDRAEGGTKIVTLETGKTLDVPLFINEGDTVEVNTETGEYIRRIN